MYYEMFMRVNSGYQIKWMSTWYLISTVEVIVGDHVYHDTDIAVHAHRYRYMMLIKKGDKSFWQVCQQRRH